VATVAALATSLLDSNAPSELPEDPVVVVDEEAGRSILSRGFPDLLLDPRQRRVRRDVDMDDSPGADLHDDEDMNDGEEGRVLGEEVAGPDLLGVIVDEGAPGLLRPRWTTHDHVATNGAGGVVDAELGRELLAYLVLSPLGMISGDSPNEGDVAAGNAGPAYLPTARTTVSDPLEILAMPSDHGLRPDEDQRPIPGGPEPAEDDPEDAISGPKSWLLLNPLVDGELLAQGRVLQGQRGLRNEHGAKDSEQSG